MRTHYPIFGFKLATALIAHKADIGIAICGTGVGISNAVNKVKGARCALVNTVYGAVAAKRDLNANVISFGGRITGIGLALEIVDEFIKTKYLPTNENKLLIKQINDLITVQKTNKNIFRSQIQGWNDGKYTNNQKQSKNEFLDWSVTANGGNENG